MFSRSSGRSRLVFPVLLGLLLAVCGGTVGTGTDDKFNGTINIASSTWTGYAIIYIANTKEIWKAHGLDVKFQDVEDPNDRLIALTAGRLEGMASTVDAFARAQSNGVPAVEVFPIDASVGGDGILAKNTIKSVQDLKGQKVAVNQGSVSEWFLAQVLQIAGQVDVAVTWEPWLSKAKARADGVVLVSSKQYPDLIMDSFAFRKDFIDKYPATVKEFMKAYYDAFDWFQKNTNEGLGIIAKATSETADDVKADLDTLTLFDLKTGKGIMGTKSAPGKINDNVKAAADFWKAQGKIDSPVKPVDAVNADFINSL
ncbi:MAG: transporter substrate-binding domain-containing protein [Chloroflexi bacterium]|nr:MAG: transporter substrate-binding domain-containing protein [Chloroflexota bacterium]